MIWLLVGLLVGLSAGAAEGDAVKVTTDSNTKLTISRQVETVNCSVCVGQGSSRVCNTQHIIGKDENTQVDFTCSKPQDIFTVQINKNFDCSGNCNLDILEPDWTLFPDFNRTFIWDLKVQPTGSLQFEFPARGLRQIQSLEQCPDELTYSVIMYTRTGPVNIGKFCQNGTITRIQLEWKGRISMEVPKHQTPQSSYAFKYSKVDGTGLAVVAVLPRGKSNTDFFSATTIPPNQMMKWNFSVPPKHNFTVQFVKYNKSQCNPKNSVTVVYQHPNITSDKKTLMDDQPANYQGNFSLLLTNCAADYKGPEPMLNFQVSVFRGGIPDVCTVNLQNNEGLSLQIEKNQDPFCELGMNAVVQEKIVVPAGSQASLTFLDCPKDKLVLTATKTIECQNVSSCSVDGTLLTIPDLDPCLPPPLSRVTWVLNAPEQGSVELSSPQGSLYQQLPGEQQCDGTISALVSTADGFNIGHFCSASKGVIQRVQFSSNITVTAAADGAKDLRQNTAPVLNVSFSSEITETLIYTVSPVSMTPVPLMTPNWPGPMKPDSSLSWIVNVPEEYGAHVIFTNVSRPVCSASHAVIQIRELGSEMEMSYREDQLLDLDHNVVRSFYLNMSNCEPMEGKFAILSQLSLQKKPQKLLGIILGLVAALFAVLIIVLIAVCVAL
ncbi:CUB domain-containing protein 1-like, partial [Clarias magur]